MALARAGGRTRRSVLTALVMIGALAVAMSGGLAGRMKPAHGAIDPLLLKGAWRVSTLSSAGVPIALTTRSYVVFSYNSSLTAFDGCQVIDATTMGIGPTLAIEEGADPARYWPKRPWPAVSPDCAARPQALAFRSLLRASPVFSHEGGSMVVVGSELRAVLEPAEPSNFLTISTDRGYPYWNIESISLDGIVLAPHNRMPTQLWPGGFLTDGCNHQHLRLVEVEGITITAFVPTTEAACPAGAPFVSALSSVFAGGVVERDGEQVRIRRNGIVLTMRIGRYEPETPKGTANTALARQLRGTSWRASSLRVGSDVVAPSPENGSVLRFAANGRVVASRDCNTAYATGFRIVGDRLVLDKAKVTTVGCRVPNTYGAFAALAQQGSLTYRKSKLTFTKADIVLTFVRG